MNHAIKCLKIEQDRLKFELLRLQDYVESNKWNVIYSHVKLASYEDRQEWLNDEKNETRKKLRRTRENLEEILKAIKFLTEESE